MPRFVGGLILGLACSLPAKAEDVSQCGLGEDAACVRALSHVGAVVAARAVAGEDIGDELRQSAWAVLVQFELLRGEDVGLACSRSPVPACQREANGLTSALAGAIQHHVRVEPPEGFRDVDDRRSQGKGEFVVEAFRDRLRWIHTDGTLSHDVALEEQACTRAVLAGDEAWVWLYKNRQCVELRRYALEDGTLRSSVLSEEAHGMIRWGEVIWVRGDQHYRLWSSDGAAMPRMEVPSVGPEADGHWVRDEVDKDGRFLLAPGPTRSLLFPVGSSVPTFEHPGWCSLVDSALYCLSAEGLQVERRALDDVTKVAERFELVTPRPQLRKVCHRGTMFVADVPVRPCLPDEEETIVNDARVRTRDGFHLVVGRFGSDGALLRGDDELPKGAQRVSGLFAGPDRMDWVDGEVVLGPGDAPVYVEEARRGPIRVQWMTVTDEAKRPVPGLRLDVGASLTGTTIAVFTDFEGRAEVPVDLDGHTWIEQGGALRAVDGELQLPLGSPVKLMDTPLLGRWVPAGVYERDDPKRYAHGQDLEVTNDTWGYSSKHHSPLAPGVWRLSGPVSALVVHTADGHLVVVHEQKVEVYRRPK